ncbi:MAG TPA: NUDIX domain-containing protein, partial [Candidatus Hydrogenedentes bacterium]|nr:NUDIX domain-containing protein [Candidatus Hydrogenedentota bacterium]
MTRIDERWYTRPDGMTRERHAAGGVVVRIERGNLRVALVREIDSDGAVLDGYVLPKGGVQPGENLETAARREVHEEAGLADLVRLGEFVTLERQDSKRAYWAFNHYALFVTNQVSGDILDKDHHFDFGWFPLEALPPMFWPDERRMLQEGRL